MKTLAIGLIFILCVAIPPLGGIIGLAMLFKDGLPK